MNIIEVQKTGIAQNPHGVDVRRIFEGDKVQVAHITLKPGEQLKKHTTPVDVLFYVLEGIGVVEIGDEKRAVGKDTLIDSPAKIPHCWYNEGTETLRVLLIRL
ncbi:cupin domain-containing protein [Syntrophorhabdus aromaticivorans]|jgi:mannose-6-phosphate isomerase-like protein (cupin superfamily)|uniref:cupin domain-containing protein n=1 Tax=Syntrophorhabdus aromaticivorans TaxID=328301 RepID=UPI000415B5A3|nr:cupin domain-containing protein [Syntrophorhabdus aromaticivorans]